MSSKFMRGFTLVEMIIAMVIIGVALAGVLSVLSRASVASADPMVVKQMSAIAEGMMDEIQLKPFGLPGAAPNQCDRTGFDDIGDYNGYDQDACAVNGDTGPAGYRVKVSVTQVASALSVAGIPSNDTATITVTVTHGADSYSLVGWRTDFAGSVP